MTIDLSYVVDKRLEDEDEKNKILSKIKAVNEPSGREGQVECKEAKSSTNCRSDEGAKDDKSDRNGVKQKEENKRENGKATKWADTREIKNNQ